MKSSSTSRSLLRTALLAAAFSGVFAASASAQLIVNGSFESQTIGTNATASTTLNNSTFTGWTIATSSGNTRFQIEGTATGSGFPTAVNGSLYMTINGAESTPGVGLIYQDFTTTIGQTYQVGFSAGRGAFNNGALAGVRGDAFNVVSGATSGGSLGFASASSTVQGSGFASPSSFSFVASGTLSRLLFSDISTGTNSVDALLDNVSVSAIPEPSTYAAIAGAAMLGLAVWRRQRNGAVDLTPAATA